MENQNKQSYSGGDRKPRNMSRNYTSGNNNSRNNSQNRREYENKKSWIEVYKNLADERYTYFWRNESPFSQHYPILFQIEEVNYNCAEQYYMSQKAELFGDKEVWREIMSCRDPMKQKSIAKNIKGFNQQFWYQKAKGVVEKATIAKFSANQSLLMILLSTRGTTLVEASPRDKRWGLGMEANDPRAIQKSTWSGTNWLGEVLTHVRDTHFCDQKYNEKLVYNPLEQEYKGLTRFSLPSSPFSPDHISIFTVENKPFFSLFHYLAFSAAKESSQELSEKVETLMDTNEMKKVVGRLLKYNRDHLIIGNFYKFEQNKALKAQLLYTTNTILCYSGSDNLFYSQTDFEMGWLLTYMRDRWMKDQKVNIDSMLSGYSTMHIQKRVYDRALRLDNSYQAAKSSYKDTSNAMPIFKTPSAFVNNQPAYGYSQKTFQTDSRSNNKSFGDHRVGSSYGGGGFKTEAVKSADWRKSEDGGKWMEKMELNNSGDRKKSRERVDNKRDRSRERVDSKRDRSRERVDIKRERELSTEKRNSETSMNFEERSEKKIKNVVNKIEDGGEVVSMDARSDEGMEQGWSPVSEFSSSAPQKGLNVKKEARNEGGDEGKNETENERTDKQEVHMVSTADSFSPSKKTLFKMENNMEYTSVLHYLAFKKADYFDDTDRKDQLNDFHGINQLTKLLKKLEDSGDWLKEEKQLINKAYKTIMAKDKNVMADLKKTRGKKLKLSILNKNDRLSAHLASVLEDLRS